MQALIERVGTKCHVEYLTHRLRQFFRHQTRGRLQENLVEDNDVCVRRGVSQLV